MKNLVHAEIRSPGCSNLVQSLYRLSYPDSPSINCIIIIIINNNNNKYVNTKETEKNKQVPRPGYPAQQDGETEDKIVPVIIGAFGTINP